MNIDRPQKPTGTASLPWDGTGQMIAIADTGIDDKHPDFTGRLPYKISLGRPGITDDPHGHGTHVTGSAAGDGSASHGELQLGIAGPLVLPTEQL